MIHLIHWASSLPITKVMGLAAHNRAFWLWLHGGPVPFL